MDNSIVNSIFDCTDCELRKEFHENNPSSTEFHSFCFYYTQKNAQSDFKYIIVLQNPGLIRGDLQENPEYKALSTAQNNVDFVAIMQKFLVLWLKNQNFCFLEKFLEILEDKKLIKYDKLEKYLDLDEENNFFSDFLVTDLVKCRAETRNIRNRHINTCAERYLCKELENYAKEKLIFSFSSRTWGFICDQYNPRSLHKSENNNHRVVNDHGFLFEIKSGNLNTHIIPLAHFSQTQFNNYLRNSYFDYLCAGLKKYRELRDSS
jgi:hypothetical protein